MTKIAVVLNTHENSLVFKDTLESIKFHWTSDILVVVDGKNWRDFKDCDIPALKLEGFFHGKPSSPYRNMCLGLMNAWNIWGNNVDWYVYMEYDCLVSSKETLNFLKAADDAGFWLLGNDHRLNTMSIPFLNRLEKADLQINYFLGCCLFFNKKFMKEMKDRNFFERFLNFTNFYEDIYFLDKFKKKQMLYDISEFMYPTLAVHYGGKIKEIACWMNGYWRGDHEHYPMRFRPDLVEHSFQKACVMHPVKEYENPVRSYHRQIRQMAAAKNTDIQLQLVTENNTNYNVQENEKKEITPSVRRVTICVCTYGDNLNLISRCLSTILGSFNRDLYELRVGCNSCSSKVINYLKNLNIDKLIISEKNLHKNGMMYHLYENITTDYVFWFDDDVYVKENCLDSLINLADNSEDNIGVFGILANCPLLYEIEKEIGIDNWINNQLWYKNKPWPNKDNEYSKDMSGFYFVLGGNYFIKAKVLKEINWPSDPTGFLFSRSRNGEDIIMSEALHQNNYRCHNIGTNYGVIIDETPTRCN